MSEDVEKQKLTCGLVMPISAIDGLMAEHWVEVQNILRESLEAIAGYECVVNLVSDADDVGVIQKRIVQNIYDSDVVVCDVSGKNPNVMFELGLRLAFDKATVIVKDDKTDYLFDTGVIEHLSYPRDLRFSQIVAFKRKLATKVVATYEAALNDPEHSTFLKSFGKFKVAKLSEDEVSAERLLIDMVAELQGQVASINNSLRVKPVRANTTETSLFDLGMMSTRVRQQIEEYILEYASNSDAEKFSELLNEADELTGYIVGRLDPDMRNRYFKSRNALKNLVVTLLYDNNSSFSRKVFRVIREKRVTNAVSEVKSVES